MKLAIKKSNSLLWKTNHDYSSIQDMLQNAKIDHSWLVCPLGESNKAITIGEYLDDPSIFSPVKAHQKNKNRVEAPTKEITLFQIGLITLISAIIFRLSIHSFLLVETNTISSFARTKFKVIFLNQCNELCMVGIWCGAILLVAHAILIKIKCR